MTDNDDNVERYDLFGRGGNDILRGGDLDDFLQGNAGDDTLIGGLGTDFALYANDGGPATVDLGITGPQFTRLRPFHN